jgi:hypothetical protein
MFWTISTLTILSFELIIVSEMNNEVWFASWGYFFCCKTQCITLCYFYLSVEVRNGYRLIVVVNLRAEECEFC